MLVLIVRAIEPILTILLGTAGAGSLILEFGTLSRLTGDDRFEKAAYKAFFALWNKRSAIGLVGNTVNILTGVRWQPSESCATEFTYYHRHGRIQKSAMWELVSTHSTNMPSSGIY